MTDEWTKIKATAAALVRRGVKRPAVGLILGTGLGRLSRVIRSRVKIPFEACPHFPRATAIGHAGQVVYGRIGRKNVIAMEGRFHAYEGYDLKEVIYPVRVMKALGVRALVLSNAAGGLNPLWRLGDIMAVTDHINLAFDSPLTGPNDDRLGVRFPDMLHAYDPRLVQLARRSALKLRIPLREGVYAGVRGPQLETPAEYRFLRQIGADAVGMSTIPEVIAARHAGLRTAAFSVITDLCLPDALEPVDIDKILAVAGRAEPVLTKLVTEVIKAI